MGLLTKSGTTGPVAVGDADGDGEGEGGSDGGALETTGAEGGSDDATLAGDAGSVNTHPRVAPMAASARNPATSANTDATEIGGFDSMTRVCGVLVGVTP